jgi:hypothetical protein
MEDGIATRSRRQQLLLIPRDSLRREVADIRADVPGGRVRRIVRRDARTLQTGR